MNSPKVCPSPTYKNVKFKQVQSPKELKDKLRKDYKNKVQNCRNMLLNRFRGSSVETDLRSTLTNIYNEIFNDSSNECLKTELLLDSEETKILEEIKQELIQDELDWCLEEYEKAQMDNVDWSLLQDDNVICPICQKNNVTLCSDTLLCSFCNIRVKTSKPLKDIKNIIFNSIEKHSNVCSNTAQFSTVCELNDTHIYLICESCMDMKLIV
ncbi:RPA-interacting protein A-like [Maniola jurtina]|uniref:RPA-interacting protein A-like n=1 Tax=Maniola jurtina TaxID=191418 RepID=UPI001E686822|nr:RPA-interacting protein A-like [Maniola jurtina]XP_045785132.1 RPA-interacting protein A-like [Maniola jurtina]